MSSDSPDNDSHHQRKLALRANIRDLGQQSDSYKAVTGGAMGLGAFLLLLAGCGAHDLATAKSGVWLAIGLEQSGVRLVSLLLGTTGTVLMAVGLSRLFRRDRSTESRLAKMEEELVGMSESKTGQEENVE